MPHPVEQGLQLKWWFRSMVNCDINHFSFRVFLSLCLGLLFSQDALAAPTKRLSCQGRITDSNGQPIANGANTLRYRIYTTKADGVGDTNGARVAESKRTEMAVPETALPHRTATHGSIDMRLKMWVNGTWWCHTAA